MADVQQDTDVKKAFRKAQLILHPDRVQSLNDPEKSYIANRVFGILNEGFKSFNSWLFNIFEVVVFFAFLLNALPKFFVSLQLRQQLLGCQSKLFTLRTTDCCWAHFQSFVSIVLEMVPKQSQS